MQAPICQYIILFPSLLQKRQPFQAHIRRQRHLYKFLKHRPVYYKTLSYLLKLSDMKIHKKALTNGELMPDECPIR